MSSYIDCGGFFGTSKGFDISLQKDTETGMQHVILSSSDGEHSATIYLFGATVTSWKDRRKECLFVSTKAQMDGKKAIRGGIPLVFPQFGAKPITKRSKMSQHGFARSSMWKYCEKESSSNENNATAVFRLSPSKETRDVWSHEFALKYTVTLRVGQLHTVLSCSNTDMIYRRYCTHIYE